MTTDGQSHAVELRLDGDEVEQFTARGDETILSAAVEAGVDLPYGCREGRCVSCTGRLLDGEISYLTEPAALDEKRREAGFVLLCIARPTADCRVAVGRDVLADAFPALWNVRG